MSYQDRDLGAVATPVAFGNWEKAYTVVYRKAVRSLQRKLLRTCQSRCPRGWRRHVRQRSAAFARGLTEPAPPSAATMVETSQIPSSFLTSLMNRQSVPVAMILSGDDLIIPSSRSRNA